MLAAIVSIAAAGAACPAAYLCVRLVDQAGAPIALAEVRLGDATDASIVVSDDNGVVHAPAEAVARAAIVTITAPGFQPLRIPRDAVRTGGDIVLTPEASPEDETIVVTARRLSTPFAPTVRRKLELLTDPSAGADVLLNVATLPGSTSLDNSADIQLRGGAIGLSRIYFNDVPLYEVTRGSAVDQVTRVASLFNASIVRNVEVYPTNPPAYLPNSAAGAVRILPDNEGSGTGSLFVGLPGVSYSTSQPLGDGAVQAYVSAIDLSASLAINPELRATTSSFRSVGGGASVSLPIGDGGEATFLAILDQERGEFPLRLLNLSGESLTRRSRGYGVASLELPIGDHRMKLDASLTATRNRFRYLDFDARASNRYIYVGAEAAGRLGPVDYRAGLAGESLSFDTTGSLAFFDAAGGPPPRGRSSIDAGYASAYAFATWPVSGRLVLAAGSRVFVGDRPAQKPVYMAAATWSAPGRRHQLILGAGAYSALVPPEFGSINGVLAARSRQVSLDYRFRGGVTLDAGVYVKADRVDQTVTDIVGADARLELQAGRLLTLELIAATSRHRVVGNRGAGDLPFLVRATARAQLSPTAAILARFTAKSGAVYTRVTGTGQAPGGVIFPVFESPENLRRLDDFVTLDMSIYERIQQWPGASQPLAFVSVTNLFDRRNEARSVYSPDFVSRAVSFYDRRAISVGLVFPFTGAPQGLSHDQR